MKISKMSIAMRKLFVSIIILASFLSCHRQAPQVLSVQTESIAIDGKLDSIADESYLQHLAPIKEDLAKVMDVQIGYAPERLWIGEPECPLLNWATEALWAAAKKTYPGTVDMAVSNMGGLRSEWPAGPVTRGNVYEMMGFDNKLVVITLKGSDIIELCESFVKYGGQGVAGLRMTAVDGKLGDVAIGGEPVDNNRLYKVATSDYLTGGADHMTALTHYSDFWNRDILIRDIYLEAVETQDTIRAQVDGRMNIL